MTVSKNPAHSDQEPQEKKEIELNNSIDELENLISDKTATGNSEGEVIPVLDEVIDPDHMEDDFHEVINPRLQSLSMDAGIFEDRLDSLIGSMDERITGELDALVNILKDTIKDSILTELKSQLEDNLKNSPSEKSESDH